MNLMQSIRIIHKSDKRISIGSTLKYAEIHNNGGVITVTEKMKRFWWAKYYEFAGGVKKGKNGQISKAKANIALNAKAEFCKNMALMKVGAKIKMPKRQYLGRSKALFKILEEWFATEANRDE
jgi:hypothetical protein